MNIELVESVAGGLLIFVGYAVVLMFIFDFFKKRRNNKKNQQKTSRVPDERIDETRKKLNENENFHLTKPESILIRPSGDVRASDKEYLLQRLKHNNLTKQILHMCGLTWDFSLNNRRNILRNYIAGLR